MTLTKKNDLEGLQDLLQKSEEFTSLIFDWVAPLGQTPILQTMYDFRNVIEKKIEELKNDYWTFERDGTIFDGEFDDQEAAQQWADDAFGEECEEEGGRNGETREEEIVLVHFKLDDDGERVEIERIDGTVEYEFYHGDLKEHGYP